MALAASSHVTLLVRTSQPKWDGSFIFVKDITLSFASLGLHESLLASLRRQGYTAPTPIQAAAIPAVLGGRDVIGMAQTGTGKTAAFVLPILQRLLQGKPGGIRALIVTPTREL